MLWFWYPAITNDAPNRCSLLVWYIYTDGSVLRDSWWEQLGGKSAQGTSQRSYKSVTCREFIIIKVRVEMSPTSTSLTLRPITLNRQFSPKQKSAFALYSSTNFFTQRSWIQPELNHLLSVENEPSDLVDIWHVSLIYSSACWKHSDSHRLFPLLVRSVTICLLCNTSFTKASFSHTVFCQFLPF